MIKEKRFMGAFRILEALVKQLDMETRKGI